MFEDIAFRYVDLAEWSSRLLRYGLTIFGGFIAGLTLRQTWTTPRAPYFMYSAAVFLAVIASDLVWLRSSQAILNGNIWAFALIDIIVAIGSGYLIAIIAIARSRDAYEHGRMAALAFIPLANLWLLFAPSQNRLKHNPTNGILWVIGGIIMLFIGAGLSGVMTYQSERMATEAQNDPTLQRAWTSFMVRSQGLESALDNIATEIQTPQRVDNMTTVERIEGDKTTLRYTYEVSGGVEELSDSMRAGVVQRNCAHGGLLPVIEAGGTIEHVYLWRDGTEVGKVKISKSICNL